jgi:cyclin-dependent kinase regulatory subunit CKS1
MRPATDSTNPSVELGTYGSFSDTSDFFDAISVSIPSSFTPLRVSPSLVAQHKEDFWYINVSSDGLYEYRTVEVPFAVASECPNRNLTEPEWRSVGITQSNGWENHWRHSSERNIFLFRRPIPGVEHMEVRLRNIEEMVNGIRFFSGLTQSHEEVKPSFNQFIVFPTYVHDWTAVFPERRDVQFTSLRSHIEFQINVLKFALRVYSVNST